MKKNLIKNSAIAVSLALTFSVTQVYAANEIRGPKSLPVVQKNPQDQQKNIQNPAVKENKESKVEKVEEKIKEEVNEIKSKVEKKIENKRK